MLISDVNNNLASQIAQARYENAMNTAAITTNATAQAQKILDAITGNRMDEMQSQINALQLRDALSGVVRYPQGWTYNAGTSPFCGGNNNCCCNTRSCCNM